MNNLSTKEPPKDIRLLVERLKNPPPKQGWDIDNILENFDTLSSALLIALEGFEWIEDHDFPHIDDPLCSCNQCTAKQTLKRINSLPITHER